ncbi:hypothetical protein [Oceanobacillus salinisoli]|uniref:hypothetical protein n=1 Tax=Oceanobacillus salinisoli TaxID=2678611 RepID=UPI0012E0E681|nr:hypothetical protein [Oceanobacillus salinisoli]
MARNIDKVVYFPDRVQNELFDILDDIFDFAIHSYRRILVHKTESIISDISVNKDLENQMFSPLIYWAIFCSPTGIRNNTIYHEYLLRNKEKLYKKHPKVKEVLVKWLIINPGFYDVVNDESLSGRVFMFRDLFSGIQKLVCVYSKKHPVPKKGELITGMLIPMGDGSYTALRGFIQIPNHLTNIVSSKIIPPSKAKAALLNHSNLSYLYPSLLKMTLQIMDADLKGRDPQ